MVIPQPGDTWGWKAVAVDSIEQLDDVTVAFTLNENIGFSDGIGQITADDVKFSIERMADPALDSPYAGALGRPQGGGGQGHAVQPDPGRVSEVVEI